MGLPAVHADINEELLVSTSDQLVLIMSLRVVHTARRCYRWCSRRGLFSVWIIVGFGWLVFLHAEWFDSKALEEAKVVTRLLEGNLQQDH